MTRNRLSNSHSIDSLIAGMANILILTPRFPYPIVAGDTLRIHHICKELSRDHSLTLLSMCATKEEITQNVDSEVFDRVERVYHPTWRAVLSTLRAVLTGEPLQLGYYASARFKKRVDELLPTCDLAIAHLVRMGQYLDDCTSVPTVLEMTDALSLNYQRVIETGAWGWKNLIYRFEQPRVQAYERRVSQRFDLVSLVSPVDRRSVLCGQNGSSDHVSVYTNGIDLSARPYSTPDPESPPVLVFIGNMRTVHNQDACEYFAAEVLPLVREQLPGAVFRIVGSAPENTVTSLQKYDGVEVTGWVDSIPSAVQGALCGIGTMRLGAGLQNKVLEYMALGLPVIANERGLEGIEVKPSRDILLANTPEEIADQVVWLANNADERMRLAETGRRFVEENHQWEKALKPLVEDVNTLLSDQS